MLILMHRDTEVCRWNREGNKHTIVNPRLLPFELRLEHLNPHHLGEWLRKRIDNLSRLYMSQVYMARNIGRDPNKIIKDSHAISVTDKFWVKRGSESITWKELNKDRDNSLTLSEIALSGDIPQHYWSKLKQDTSSLYTVKGVFPKAILGSYIVKRDNNAEYEDYGYQIGKVLDIPTAKVERVGSDTVKSEIFTTEDLSLVHAGELLHLTQYGEQGIEEHQALYDYFQERGRKDLTSQLEMLYLLNYLVVNTDLHYENFGFLYNEDFKIVSVAPAYDFNNAFQPYDDLDAYYPWIVDNLPKFVESPRFNPAHDKLEKLIDTFDTLSSIQKLAILKRWEHLIRLRGEGEHGLYS